MSEKERGDLMKEISTAILGVTVLSGPRGYVETQDGARFDFGAWHLTAGDPPPAPRRLTRGQRLVRMVFGKAAES